MTTQDQDTLLEFPCDFPIKIMGRNHADLEQVVLTIVNTHVTDFDADSMSRRESKNGKYVSITVTILAQNKMQIDNIYQELTAHELVMMAL